MNKIQFSCGEKRRLADVATQLHRRFLAASLGLACCALWPSTGLAQLASFTSTGPITFSNGVAASDPYPSVIYVGTNGAASLAGTVYALTVTFNFDSGFWQNPEDLSAILVGPNGTAFEFMSYIGGTSEVNGVFLTFDDTAGTPAPMTLLTDGSFKPASYFCKSGSTNGYPLPAPQVFNTAAPCGANNLTGNFGNEAPYYDANGAWQLFLANRLLGPGGTLTSWTLNFNMRAPSLSVSCFHTGSFCRGEVGAQYSVIVTNAGPGPTGGSVPAMVVDTLPTGLTPTAVSGSGWNCVISNQTVTCTQTNRIEMGNAYPPISISVNIATNATGVLENSVTLTGSNINPPQTANDFATIFPPNITCSTNITVQAIGQCPVVVDYDISTSGNCSLSSLVATPPSGSAFPVGTNTVSVVATYASDIITNSCSFTVTVLPGTVPRLAADLVGTNVIISWYATNTGCYALQFSPSLSFDPSTTYAGPFFTNGTRILFTNVLSTGSGFYRLGY